MPTKRDRFYPKTVPDTLPGSLHAEYSRCGKPTCHCAPGELHGPYWRCFWRENGRTRSAYVRLADVEDVSEKCARHLLLHLSLRRARTLVRDFFSYNDAVLAAAQNRSHEEARDDD